MLLNAFSLCYLTSQRNLGQSYYHQMSKDEKDIFDRGTPEKFGKGDGLHSTEQKLSIYLAACLEAARTKQQRPLSTHEIEDLERHVTFEFAKVHGLWIDDLYSLGVPLKGGGNEHLGL